MALYRPYVKPSRTAQLLYRGVGLDFNSTADQLLAKLHAFPVVHLLNAYVSKPSASIASAVGGLYTASAKGGVAVVAASQTYTGVTGTGLGVAIGIANAGREEMAIAALYLSLTTPQGSAATANYTLIGWGYDS